MKLFGFVLCLFIAPLLSPAQGDFRDGDVVFIRNKEMKGKNLLPNGKSKYNYVGVIFIEKDSAMVYHATQPFSKCTIRQFVYMSENKDFAIKHLVEEEALTAAVVSNMHRFAESKLGTPYDNSLKLDNDDLYNAEFVWKIYQTGLSLDLCIPRQIKEYKLESSATEFLTDAYGPAILNEKIVTVGDIFQSQFLEE